jgi:hypothetical protein
MSETPDGAAFTRGTLRKQFLHELVKRDVDVDNPDVLALAEQTLSTQVHLRLDGKGYLCTASNGDYLRDNNPLAKIANAFVARLQDGQPMPERSLEQIQAEQRRHVPYASS